MVHSAYARHLLRLFLLFLFTMFSGCTTQSPVLLETYSEQLPRSASDFTLDTNKSYVYYEAKKKQFFNTYPVRGINRGLSGSLEKRELGYKGKLRIDVFTFDSNDSYRDDNVEEYLNAETYKLMTYDYEIRENIAEGDMKINGVTKKITFPVTLKDENGQLFIEGNIRIRYSDFNIETPSNFFLRAHDDLVIGAKLYFNH
ncbi:YceI family protein [Sulfurimonas sp. HSL3-7]|uniref:YceI family protein n=1 Tax=Sulfonitrofixus jiaomeiensis TaxID=3131938 RepID=UPI0031F89E97